MWSEQKLMNLVPYAAEALTRHHRSVSKILTQGNYPPDSDIDRADWGSYSLGERAYYVLFALAYHKHDLVCLKCICPPEQFTRISTLMLNRIEAYKRELTRAALEAVAMQRMAAAKRRQAKNHTQTPRQVGWTAEDVPAEYFDVATDEEPHRPPRPITILDKEIPPSPVRKVSVEEYYATRKTPLPKGVALEFDKVSPLWLKLDDRYADKSYEGDEEPSWYKEKE